MNEPQKLLIERACERLQHSYARFIDFRDYEGFAELFCVDGVLDAGSVLEGREAIFTSCQKRPAHLRSRHVVTNSYIDVLDEGTARGICYLTLYRSVGDGTSGNAPLPETAPAAIGHYEDRFRLTGSRWLFSRRRLHLAFRDDSRF